MIEGTSLETTPLDIAKKISKKFAEKQLVAKISYTNRYTNFFTKVIDCDAEEEAEV